MATAVTTKGQVTIPKGIRDLLGIRPGSLVEFEQGADGRVILKNVDGATKGRFARFRGHAKTGMTTEELMSLTRGRGD